MHSFLRPAFAVAVQEMWQLSPVIDGAATFIARLCRQSQAARVNGC